MTSSTYPMHALPYEDVDVQSWDVIRQADNFARYWTDQVEAWGDRRTAYELLGEDREHLPEDLRTHGRNVRMELGGSLDRLADCVEAVLVEDVFSEGDLQRQRVDLDRAVADVSQTVGDAYRRFDLEAVRSRVGLWSYDQLTVSDVERLYGERQLAVLDGSIRDGCAPGGQVALASAFRIGVDGILGSVAQTHVEENGAYLERAFGVSMADARLARFDSEPGLQRWQQLVGVERERVRQGRTRDEATPAWCADAMQGLTQGRAQRERVRGVSVER